MSYCLNSQCSKPENIPTAKFCHSCGSKLLLKDRYQAVKQIGQGGFGKTFLAVDEDKPSKPFCVIKQFFPQALEKNNIEKAAELFRREAVGLDELGKHPQIPDLLAYFSQDNQQYLVQEFIEGENLAEELANKGKTFTETQIRSLLNDLLSILIFIHQKGVIHRDIKPENIIRRRETEERKSQLVLVDFGAAKSVTQSTLGKAGTTIGTPGYIPPEQVFGRATFASDIYSLGVTCIHLLTGLPPNKLYNMMDGSWSWREHLQQSVNEKFADLLDKMLADIVALRYQSAAEILQDLNNLIDTDLDSQLNQLKSQFIHQTQSKLSQNPPVNTQNIDLELQRLKSQFSH